MIRIVALLAGAAILLGMAGWGSVVAARDSDWTQVLTAWAITGAILLVGGGGVALISYGVSGHW